MEKAVDPIHTCRSGADSVDTAVQLKNLLLELDLLANRLSRHTGLEQDTQCTLVSMRRADLALDLLLASIVEDGFSDVRFGLLARVQPFDYDNHLIAGRLVDASLEIVDDCFHSFCDFAPLYKRFLRGHTGSPSQSGLV